MLRCAKSHKDLIQTVKLPIIPGLNIFINVKICIPEVDFDTPTNSKDIGQTFPAINENFNDDHICYPPAYTYTHHRFSETPFRSVWRPDVDRISDRAVVTHDEVPDLVSSDDFEYVVTDDIPDLIPTDNFDYVVTDGDEVPDLISSGDSEYVVTDNVSDLVPTNNSIQSQCRQHYQNFMRDISHFFPIHNGPIVEEIEIVEILDDRVPSIISL